MSGSSPSNNPQSASGSIPDVPGDSRLVAGSSGGGSSPSPSGAPSPHSVLDAAIEEHNPSHVFALFSGGHDSLAATMLTSWHERFDGVIHINTGIGIEATREFVRETCRKRDWPLLEYGPWPRGHQNSYEEMVKRWGFPGPAGHGIMYRRLKERWLNQVVREHKRGPKDRIAFVTGIRSQESVRRMRHQMTGYERQGAKVWVAPIHDWTKADVNNFLECEELERNPVVDLIHMSGECKCGAFARPEEREEDRVWFPKFAAYLDRLESEVEDGGQLACVWGRRPDDVHRDQERMFSILSLCTSCEATRA